MIWILYDFDGTNVGGDIYGSGYRSMYSSTIENVNNTLSNINNVYNLYIDCTYTFEGSTITHIHNKWRNVLGEEGSRPLFGWKMLLKNKVLAKKNSQN